MTVSAASINVPLEALFDRTACLVPDVQVFFNSGTWTKPAHALFVSVDCVGAGGDGGAGGIGDSSLGAGGGGGGGSGVFEHAQYHAATIPSTLTVGVGANGGDASYVAVSPGSYLIYSPGGNNGTAGNDGTGTRLGGEGGAPVAGRSSANAGDGGAGGGVAEAGTDGTSGDSIYLDGNGGFLGYGGGAVGGLGTGGLGGEGWGGGGGGGGGGAGSGIPGAGGGGGGGGGRGWGHAPTGNAGDGDTAVGVTGGSGGSAAPGIVVITSWRGVAL